nr:MAG: excinuclease ABC subunit C [Pseudomonadota bacterium]
MSFDGRQFAATLPRRPGVYRMYGSDTADPAALLYVGKAASLRDRVGSYFQSGPHAPKVEVMLRQVRHIEVTVTANETEALLLEYNLIKQHRPRFNVVLRDDKSFPWIQLHEHEFPRLSVYRGPRSGRARYFGPYPNVGAVRAALLQLQKLFRLRNCRDGFFANRTRPCLQYQIGRCSAPCVGLIDRESYARDVESAVMVLEGRDTEVTRMLERRMHEAAEALEFEKAAALRDQLNNLRAIQAEQAVDTGGSHDVDVFAIVGDPGDYAISLLLVRGGRNLGTTAYFPRAPGAREEVLASFLLQHYAREEPPAEVRVNIDLPDAGALGEALTQRHGRQVVVSRPARGLPARWAEAAQSNAQQALRLRLSRRGESAELLESLREALDLPVTPARIECFDISHTGGEGTVASCVVFTTEGIARKEYRRFNITGAAAGDDYGALREAVRRRFTRIRDGESPCPDLLLIDGGAGQVNAVLPVLAELGFGSQLVVGVSKGPDRRPGQERLHLGWDGSVLALPADSRALRLIQRIRDEAHRFAIQGHRRRRARRHQESVLETVPGLGPARRRALLQHFGGLQGVMRAGVPDLAQVKGIGPALAQLIYDRLHPGA